MLNERYLYAALQTLISVVLLSQPVMGQYYSESRNRSSRVLEGELTDGEARVGFYIREGQMVAVRGLEASTWYSFTLYFEETEGLLANTFEITSMQGGGEKVAFVEKVPIGVGQAAKMKVGKQSGRTVSIVVRRIVTVQVPSSVENAISSDEAKGDRCCVTCNNTKYCASMIAAGCGKCEACLAGTFSAQ